MMRHQALRGGFPWTIRVLVASAALVAVAGGAPAPPGAPATSSRGNAPVTEAPAVEPASFDDLLERVRLAAGAKDLPHRGWKDPVLQRGLEQLVQQVTQAANRPDLVLPVTPADMQDTTAEPKARELIPGTVWVGRGGSVGFATRAIILADGSVDVGFANECVIIARGAVEIAHGAKNVVLAGQFIHVSHDGNNVGGPPDEPAPSLLMSGGTIDVSHAHATLCAAPSLVRISHANGVTFLNSPNLETSRQNNCALVNAANITLGPRPAANPLAGELTVLRVTHNDDHSKRSATVDVNGTPVDVPLGGVVRDAAGKVVPEFADWPLVFVCEDFALFSNGREDAGFLAGNRK